MGPVTGQATVYSVFSEPMLEAQATIKNGGLNGVYLGDVAAEAVLDRENKSIFSLKAYIPMAHNNLGKQLNQDRLANHNTAS